MVLWRGRIGMAAKAETFEGRHSAIGTAGASSSSEAKRGNNYKSYSDPSCPLSSTGPVALGMGVFRSVDWVSRVIPVLNDFPSSQRRYELAARHILPLMAGALLIRLSNSCHKAAEIGRSVAFEND